MVGTAAQEASSFGFLAPYGPLYLRLAVAAERTLAIDPSLTLVSLRQLAEAFAKHAAGRAGLIPVDRRDAQIAQVDLLRLLEQRGIVRDKISECFHMLRRVGNAAVHDFVGSRQEALDALAIAFRVACWFHKTFGDIAARTTWQPPRYAPPTDPTSTLRALQEDAAKARAEADAHRADAERAKALLDAEAARRDEEARLRKQAEAERAEWESLAAAYEADLAKAAAEQAKVDAKVAEAAARAPAEQEKIVVAQATAATATTELDEAETRVLIDAQLRAAGWEVNSKTLRWSSGARPEKGKNRAIAEVPTHSQEDGQGVADYVLFVGLQPYAVVEAKRKHKKVASYLEQAKRYSRSLSAVVPHSDATHAAEGGALAWGWSTSLSAKPTDPRYVVPFLYSTNGRPYVRQLEVESGVWFLDVRNPTNHPRALMGWHSPEALVAMRAQDIAAAQAKLAAEPADTIQQALDLRDYQVRAVAAVEGAIGRGQRELLVAMATGTGKTRTTIALIHRLLKSQRFRRVLFLVDRSALGKQAQDAFGEIRLENLQTFAQNYDVMGLEDVAPATETKVHVATVQGMVQRILSPADDAAPIQIDAYDCIIIDESHRGYTLDREMSEGEHELRGFESYVSTYRRVLDHFDAVKIGLTATPAAHTREIFGPPVFVYSYPEAVADGWLVDHEPPIRIVTQLAKHGIRFERGAEIQTLLKDGEVQLSLLPDEMEFDVAEFNRTVITDGFNRAVAAELAQHLDPTGPAKTIIFCVDDDHAERLVAILKAALEDAWGPLEDDVVKKITGAVDRPLDQIRRFKNEANPRIAITVDLLSTGVDVPAVSNIVFLRRIKSRILYEQMLGRATRLCKPIGKEVFRIYDAVGLYDALSQVSDMKPLVKDVTRTTKELVTELLDPRSQDVQGHDVGRTHADEVHRELVERLRRVVRRLGKALGYDKQRPEEIASAIESLEAALGAPLDKLPDQLHDAGAAGAIKLFTDTPELAVLIERIAASTPGHGGKTAVIAPHTDTVIAIERGYGEGNTRPEDYLAAFQRFIEQNRNQIAALTVVCTRPRELTRAQLRELRLKLDAAGYSEARLRTAFRDWKNQDIAATIVGFIRQRALGSPLVPYAERVDRAVAKVLAAGTFKPGQKKWLEQIAKQLKKEIVVDEEAFSGGAFENFGGWSGINKQFDGRLQQILNDLGDEVWNDEKAATA
ncbi:MAG: type I restriction-modification system endonuclease [Kofleriaceae bacterium]|nr:type I restriction-modification system endonuclease [Kofleriaceae bacterium]